MFKKGGLGGERCRWEYASVYSLGKHPYIQLERQIDKSREVADVSEIRANYNYGHGPVLGLVVGLVVVE